MPTNRLMCYVNPRDDYWYFPILDCPKCGTTCRAVDWKERDGSLCCPACCRGECRCGKTTDDVEGDGWGWDFKERWVCNECQGKPPVVVGGFPLTEDAEQHKPGPIERAMRWWRKA